MATKKNRISITLSDEMLDRLEYVNEKYGISKTSQIQNLIIKYLDVEYGNTSRSKMLSQDSKEVDWGAPVGKEYW